MKLKLVLFVACALLFAGCAQKKSLVGTWTMPMPKEWGIEGGEMNVAFAADNTLNATAEYQGLAAEVPGTYELSDNSLTVTFKDIKIDQKGGKIPQFFIDGMLGKAKDAIKKPYTGKVEWKTDNEVLFTTNEGPSISMKRKTEGK